MITDTFEVLDKRFTRYAMGNVHAETLFEGTRWAEGAVYFAAGRYLLWSDIPNDRLLRYDETDDSVSVFEQPCRNHNGHTVDREGRLLSCEHRGRCVSRIEQGLFTDQKWIDLVPGMFREVEHGRAPGHDTRPLGGHEAK